jgi:hypothetical protein
MLLGVLMLAGVIACPDASAYHPETRTPDFFAVSAEARPRDDAHEQIASGQNDAFAYETASGATLASESAASKSFFDGTRYTDKVLTQMSKGPGEFHSFPESVAAFEKSGTIRSVTGGDGVTRQMLEIPGSYPSGGGTWKDGVFQFMKEPDGAINHRLFVPNKPPAQ